MVAHQTQRGQRQRAWGWLPALLLLLATPSHAAPPGPESAPGLRRALEVSRAHRAALLDEGRVVGTGVGLGANGRPVIRVLTEAPGAALPATLGGVPVEERVTGRVYALRGPTCDVDGDAVCETTERWPLPVPIGVSIGHPSITAGTIGARVTDGVSVFALSNNHVLAASNAASVGDAALQPGPFDGGSLAAGDDLGTLADFEPIAFCTVILFPILVDCPVTNLFDGAIASTTTAELGFATPLGEFGSAVGYGAPNPLLHPAYGDPAVLGDEDLNQLLGLGVQKHGRTTGLTAGAIDTLGLTIDVCYDEFCSLVARFEDQLAISGAFSAGGDSGSLVVTDDAVLQPVGLLFAGSETQTIVSRIDLVLDRFDVTIDDGGTSAPITNAALQALDVPPFVVLGDTETVSVTVRNAGTEPLPAFDVTLDDTLEGTQDTLGVPALAPAAQAVVDFAWTPTLLGDHLLVATLQIADDDPGDDSASADGSVVNQTPGVSLRTWRGTAHTDQWTQVTLPASYGTDLVVVCTPEYDVTGLGPLVARVRNATGAGFEVGLGRPWFGAFPARRPPPPCTA